MSQANEMPSTLTGEYATLWKSFADKVDANHQVTVTDPAVYEKLDQLATMGGVEVENLSDGTKKVTILYEPEAVGVEQENPSVQAAAKHTKFSDR